MRKIYKTPHTRFVGLDPDELLHLQGTSTNLEDTSYGGDTDDEMEAEAKHIGIWGWSGSDL
ncbi:MAG: hypothetical protein MJZ43_00570 [Bacteroidaceae bacterium]|nr:hypothetical protein [Bacteroidaceae bacterium]